MAAPEPNNPNNNNFLLWGGARRMTMAQYHAKYYPTYYNLYYKIETGKSSMFI